MKVLFNTYPMAFDVPGGGEVQLMAYHAHLPEQGVTPLLFDLWKPQFNTCDIVHFFSAVGGSLPFCHYVKQRGLPLVVTSSLWITPETRDHYPSVSIREQFALADIVVTNADMESDALAGALDLPRDKFMTVYNAVAEECLKPANPALFLSQMTDCKNILLNVGNIEPRKNQLALIRALKQHPDCTLVVIGNIRDKAYADQCFTEAGDQLRFLGPLPRGSELLRSAMRACRLFVMPSILETPSLAALEAGAQGVPVVITEVGSTREYFGDTVTYLDPLHIDSISNAISSALKAAPNPELTRARITERFTWRKTLPALVEIYRRILSVSSTKSVH